MDNSILQKLQFTQLEILSVFDAFCKEHCLQYSLYGGTLLGAVRHKGFIPWDDDLDVCMSRYDYERFVSLWETNHPHGYLLQNKENTPSFRQTFSKLRKDHTTFLQESDAVGQYHTGIFIDVIPLDRIPSQRNHRTLFKFCSMLFLLMTKEFPPPKASSIVRFGSSVILACTSKALRERIRKACLHQIKKYNSHHHLELISTEVLSTLHKPLAANLFDSYTMLPFEDREYMCFSNWNDLLRSLYGDFMQLPPEKDRVWKHHPIIIDFEHNYEELTLLE